MNCIDVHGYMEPMESRRETLPPIATKMLVGGGRERSCCWDDKEGLVGPLGNYSVV